MSFFCPKIKKTMAESCSDCDDCPGRKDEKR